MTKLLIVLIALALIVATTAQGQWVKTYKTAGSAKVM